MSLQLWSLLSAVVAVHTLLYVIDRTLSGTRAYDRLIKCSGFDPPKLFQIRWSTQRFNRTFSRLAASHPKFLNLWFNAGAVVAIALLFPSMVLLVKTLLSSLIPAGGESDKTGTDRVVLQPVLPGVNLPLSELGYYFFTLLLCSVIHESGHAVAAAAEDVRVLGSGAFVLLVLPAAFVDLPTDQLMAVRPWQQLKVFAAGVWHNVVLAAAAYLVLFSVPSLAAGLYRTGEGVAVTSVRVDSTVTGPTGLVVGDEITDINGCAVLNAMTWRECLTKSLADAESGVCLDQGFVSERSHIMLVSEEAKNVTECCDEESSKSSICFVAQPKKSFKACLPVRSSLERSGGAQCNATMECPSGETCMRAALPDQSRLLRARRRGRQDFLFVGSPAEVYQAADVSEFLPAHGLPLPAWLPRSLELLSHYVASFSGALAVLNVVPCFLLDGNYIARTLVDLLLPARRDGGCASDPLRATVALTFTVVGTTVLAVNIAVGVWKLL